MISTDQEHGIKQILEAVLFASSEPITLTRLSETLDPTPKQEIIENLDAMKKEYLDTNRAFELVEIAGGYLLRTKIEYSPYLQQLFYHKKTDRLSRAALEVLAIIAHKQPITHPQIVTIRGVDSSNMIHTLHERGLIETAGKLEAPGRPILYTTTKKFLEHFGLRLLDDIVNPS